MVKGGSYFFLKGDIKLRLLSFNRVISYSQCLRVTQQTEILVELLRDRVSSCSIPWKVSEMLAGKDKSGRCMGRCCVSMSVHSSVLTTIFLHPVPPQKFHRWVQCMAGVCINSENFVTPGYVFHEICQGPISLFNDLGLWETAWKFTKTADNVRTIGRYVWNQIAVLCGVTARGV